MARVFGGSARHGYNTVLPGVNGPARVCTYAINVGPGAHELLRCRTV